MYNKIKNPINGNIYKLKSIKGKYLLKKYLYYIIGGAWGENDLSLEKQIIKARDTRKKTIDLQNLHLELREKEEKIEKQLYLNSFQNKLDKIPSVKEDKFVYSKTENSEKDENGEKVFCEKVFCEKIISGKKLLFILEKVCHGTNVLPITHIWEDFILNRQELLCYRFQNNENKFMDEHRTTLINIWNLNSKEWEHHILDKNYLKYSSIYISKIFQILIDKKIDHPILKDPNTKKYYELLNKQQIKSDLIDAITMFHRCITRCQNEKKDTWVAYVIENDDYHNKVENFDKTKIGFVYDKENYYKNLEPIILLALTITVDFTQKKPYQYQAGIHRSVDYFYNKGKKISKGVPKLSLRLHGFSSRAIDLVYGDKFRYIFSDPLNSMHKILQEANIITIPNIEYSNLKNEENTEIKEKMNSYLEEKAKSEQEKAKSKKKIKINKFARFLKIPLMEDPSKEDPSKEDLLYVHENICIPDKAWHTVVSYNSEFNKLF